MTMTKFYNIDFQVDSANAVVNEQVQSEFLEYYQFEFQRKYFK